MKKSKTNPRCTYAIGPTTLGLIEPHDSISVDCFYFDCWFFNFQGHDYF